MSPGRYILWVLAWMLVAGVALRISAELIPGAAVTSWWRSFWHNRAIGGSLLSRHQVGLAVDLVPATAAIKARARLAYGWIPTATIINEGDHIHVQLG